MATDPRPGGPGAAPSDGALPKAENGARPDAADAAGPRVAAPSGGAGPGVADGADAIQDAWRRELPGVPVGSIGVITRVWWAAKLFGEERRRTLSRLGIDVATLDLLSTLRRAGPPYRMSPSDLATACRVSRGAITQRVTRAVKSGLVSRDVSASGYHARAITLTDEGHALTESAVTHLLAYEQRLLGGLGAEQQDRLAELLRDLLAALGEQIDVGGGHLGQVGEERGSPS